MVFQETERERLVNLLRDIQRKAAQYYQSDPEGLYDDITDALSIAELPLVTELLEHNRSIEELRGIRHIRPNKE